MNGCRNPQRDRWRQRLRTVWLLALLAIAVPAFGQVPEGHYIVVVGQVSNAYHARFVATLREQLAGRDGNQVIDFVGAGEFAASDAYRRAAAPQTLIVLGSEAARRIAPLKRREPTIYAMLPESLFDALYAPQRPPRNVTAVYVDQPLARFIALIRVALPQAHELATVFGPYSKQYRVRLARLSAAAGLQLRSLEVEHSDEVGAAIDKLARPGTVLLTLPDHTVLNSATAKTVILGTYLHQVPLVGYSHALVKAGAVMGVYSTPAQMARQVAAIVKRNDAGGGLPAATHPQWFSVSVNYQVARVLGLTLPEETVIHQRMLAAEETR